MPTTNAAIIDTRKSPYAKLQPVPIDAWRVDDAFWSPRMEQNRVVTIPSQWELLRRTGRLDNFRAAAGDPEYTVTGMYFNDSDVYKWLEAASWALLAGPDAELSAHLDEAIALLAAAQRPDGYLNSYFSGERADQRWTILDLHELYCAGHLIQAAIAHHRVTGKTTLLEVARKFADHICAEFGTKRQADRPWADGHQEVELALVELSRETGDPKYAEQAAIFIEARGHKCLGRPYGRWGSEYHQDHLPLREMQTLEGHAVRAMYYLCGGADVVLETGDAELQSALERLWEDTRIRKLYVSGALGARHEGESFGDAFELPNAQAYAETCAAIASVFFNQRMLALTGDGKYADLLEYTLYNAVLPGISLDGEEYFYVNPLADRGKHRREPWYDVACGPPNIARLLASLPGYAASTAGNGVWLHLYLSGTVTAPLENGKMVNLRISSRYPWDGDIDISVDTSGTFALNLRIPTWAFGAKLEIGDFAADVPIQVGGYATIEREWRAGDTVHLSFPMVVRRIVTHPAVMENEGRIALRRGPLLYCAEGVDHPNTDVWQLTLADDEPVTPSWRPDLLGGVNVLTADALYPSPDPGWDRWLYRGLAETLARPAVYKHRILTAIPYFAWANREAGAMQVWLRRRNE
ncbi:MAG: glycoside hydrolase family 127 protein [Thermomicrobiales bacterium]